MAFGAASYRFPIAGFGLAYQNARRKTGAYVTRAGGVIACVFFASVLALSLVCSWRSAFPRSRRAAGRDPAGCGARDARAQPLAELRCLVCQNQSIDNSNAPLARDLRLLVRERLRPATATRPS